MTLLFRGFWFFLLFPIFSMGVAVGTNVLARTEGVIGFIALPLVDLVALDVRFALEEAAVVAAAQFFIPELFGDQPAYRRTQLLYGEKVVILEEKAGWCRVRVPGQLVIDDQGRRGCHGWIQARSLCLDVAVPESGVCDQRAVVLIKPMVCVYEKKSRASSIILELALGTELKGAMRGDWCEVVLLDGRRGFVLASDCCDFRAVVARGEHCQREQIIACARQFIGHSYAWGGRSAGGIDCSGLTQLAFLCAGKPIPRYAHGQWLSCRSVDPAHAKPGDLIFLGTVRDEKLVMIHVMMYAGHDDLIEANGLVGCVHVVSSFKRFGKPFQGLRNGEEVGLRRVLFCGSLF